MLSEKPLRKTKKTKKGQKTKKAKNNFSPFSPFENTLLIDLDEKANIETFWERRKILLKHGLIEKEVSLKKTAKGYHITIKLCDKDITEMELIFFQLFLMSDCMRELFNYIDYINDEFDNLFFCVKIKNKVLISQERGGLISKGEKGEKGEISPFSSFVPFRPF